MRWKLRTKESYRVSQLSCIVFEQLGMEKAMSHERKFKQKIFVNIMIFLLAFLICYNNVCCYLLLLYSCNVVFGHGNIFSLFNFLGACGHEHFTLWESSLVMMFILTYLMLSNASYETMIFSMIGGFFYKWVGDQSQFHKIFDYASDQLVEYFSYGFMLDTLYFGLVTKQVWENKLLLLFE